MIAEIENDLICLTSEITGAKRYFESMATAVSWGDVSSDDAAHSEHGIVMAGIQEDSRINVLREYRGKIHEVKDQVIEWKDRFFAKKIWTPQTPVGFYRMLQDADGLGRYIVRARGRRDAPIYAQDNPSDRWNYFRSYAHTGSVLPLPSRLIDDMEAAHATVNDAMRAGDVLVDFRYVPQLEKAMGQSTKEILLLPIARAFIHIVWVLWDNNPLNVKNTFTTTQPKAPWTNFNKTEVF